MLRKIWQWLKGLWQQLLGRKPTPTTSRRTRGWQQQAEEENSTTSSSLSDTDYEFLFSQLLEGVAHGWHEQRLVSFFAKLGDRGQPDQWVAWLQRFGQRVLASPSPNHQLGARLVRLGEVSQGVRPLEPIGQVAYQIGQQLLTRGSSSSAVWEYEEASQSPMAEEPSEQSESPAAPAETITLDQLFVRLQQDAHLAQQMAQELGIASHEPQAIMEAFLAHLQEVQRQQQKTPETDQDWFNLGFQQAQAGQLEQAIASWEQALALNPNLSQAWYNRGNALRQLKRWEEALESFERVLQLQPDNHQAWNDRGNTLYNLEQWEAAIASWDRVLELQPDYYQAWFNRGCAWEHLGRTEEAIASYQQTLELEPNFELAKSRMSQLQGNP